MLYFQFHVGIVHENLRNYTRVVIYCNNIIIYYSKSFATNEVVEEV